MTDLREVVDSRGPSRPPEFVCDAIVGSEVLDAVQLSEAEILRKTAAAVGLLPASRPGATLCTGSGRPDRWSGASSGRIKQFPTRR